MRQGARAALTSSHGNWGCWWLSNSTGASAEEDAVKMSFEFVDCIDVLGRTVEFVPRVCCTIGEEVVALCVAFYEFPVME